MIDEAFWPALERVPIGLAPDVRERAAKLWVERALLEHASVASFGRFALGLLRVGAPPELLEGAHRAALDEIRHARLCFALASAYAGRAIGPGELDLDGALSAALSLEALSESTVVEGCVGETLAALEARHCLRSARPKAVRIALRIIAEDELSHAELAWTFVRWSVTIRPALRAVVRAAFERACADAIVSGARHGCHEPPAGHGFIDSERAARLRARAVRSWIQPAAACSALL